MTSQLYNDIIDIITTHGEISGMEQVANMIGCRNHTHVYKLIRRIERDGLITVIHSHGGRGCRTVVRSNRNSPGCPRKVRR